MLRAALVVLVFVFVGCGTDRFAAEGEACAPAQACAEGLTCAQGRCVQVATAEDAGARADAGVERDAGVDAGVPDAGVADAGVADAGGVDAGVADAGAPDAGGLIISDGGLLADGGLCACVAPPPPRCVGATLEAAEPVGACTARGCEYRVVSRVCAAGCSEGHCAGQGWVHLEPDGGLDLFPTALGGTDVDDVWFVGWSGRIHHWDGARWSQGFTGNVEEVEALAVSARDDVSIVTRQGNVFHFDGARWEAVVQLPVNGTVACAQAIGREDFLVAISEGLSFPPFKLLRVTGGRVRLLATAGSAVLNYAPQSCAMHVRTVDDVYVGDSIRGTWHYDGQHFDQLASAPATLGFTAVGGLLCSASIGELAAWDGTSWQLWPAPSGKVYRGIAGTSPSELFLGVLPLTSATDPSFIGRWDGAQLQPEPGTNVRRLHDLWRAPGGEIFAVSSDGEVLRGP